MEKTRPVCRDSCSHQYGVACQYCVSHEYLLSDYLSCRYPKPSQLFSQFAAAWIGMAELLIVNSHGMFWFEHLICVDSENELMQHHQRLSHLEFLGDVVLNPLSIQAGQPLFNVAYHCFQLRMVAMHEFHAERRNLNLILWLGKICTILKIYVWYLSWLWILLLI